MALGCAERTLTPEQPQVQGSRRYVMPITWSLGMAADRIFIRYAKNGAVRMEDLRSEPAQGWGRTDRAG